MHQAARGPSHKRRLQLRGHGSARRRRDGTPACAAGCADRPAGARAAAVEHGQAAVGARGQRWNAHQQRSQARAAVARVLRPERAAGARGSLVFLCQFSLCALGVYRISVSGAARLPRESSREKSAFGPTREMSIRRAVVPPLQTQLSTNDAPPTPASERLLTLELSGFSPHL